MNGSSVRFLKLLLQGALLQLLSGGAAEIEELTGMETHLA